MGVKDAILLLSFLKDFILHSFGDALFSLNEKYINQTSSRWIASIQICGALKVKLDQRCFGLVLFWQEKELSVR